MISRWRVVIVLLALIAVSLAAEESGGGSKAFGVGSLAAGYDEGLVARYRLIPGILPDFIPNLSVYLGLAYFVQGADTVGEQPLNCFAFKIGGEYTLDFMSLEKFKVHTFLEWREEMVQNQVSLPGAEFNHHERYNQWNSIIRIGARPEFFINKRFSFDYRFGLQFMYHGSDFEPNDDNSGLEKMDNGYAEFGVYEARFPPIVKDVNGNVASGFFNQSFLWKIGFNIYIF